MLRGPWLPGPRWMGLAGRSAGVALLPGRMAAHAGWPQAFCLDDSPNPAAQDLYDVQKFRVSLTFAQSRLSARGVPVSGSSSSIPVGLIPQTLLRSRTLMPQTLLLSLALLTGLRISLWY